MAEARHVVVRLRAAADFEEEGVVGLLWVLW